MASQARRTLRTRRTARAHRSAGAAASRHADQAARLRRASRSRLARARGAGASRAGAASRALQPPSRCDLAPSAGRRRAARLQERVSNEARGLVRVHLVRQRKLDGHLRDAGPPLHLHLRGECGAPGSGPVLIWRA
jgi:hypothetical protein